MSVRDKAKLLNIPVPGSRPAPKKESEAPQLLDVSAMKSRPKKNGSRSTLRSAHSAPDVRENEAESSKDTVLHQPTVTTPGKISIGELRQLALQEKERTEREKAAEEAKSAVAKVAEEKLAKEVSPRNSKIDDLLALNAQLNRSPPKLNTPESAPTPGSDEKKVIRKKKKGVKKIGISKSSSSINSDMEEESSSEDGNLSLKPQEESKEKTVEARKKKRRGTPSSASSGLKKKVAELEKQLAEAKGQVEREKQRREATDQILSKLLSSKNDEALSSAIAQWHEAMSEIERLKSISH